jgi:hypothetical protein
MGEQQHIIPTPCKLIRSHVSRAHAHTDTRHEGTLSKWLRTRSSAPGFSAEVPKGGVEFINFPFAPFGSEICSEQPWPRLLESGVRSKRGKREVSLLELKNLKNREISFLTRILGRMTPICFSPFFFLNIVHKYALYDPIIP